jgi:hypothetical protein
MLADFFNCLVVELFRCLEDAGSYYSETFAAAISPCLVLTADCYLRLWLLAFSFWHGFLHFRSYSLLTSHLSLLTTQSSLLPA